MCLPFLKPGPGRNERQKVGNGVGPRSGLAGEERPQQAPGVQQYIRYIPHGGGLERMARETFPPFPGEHVFLGHNIPGYH
jgi:hypothetical protein